MAGKFEKKKKNGTMLREHWVAAVVLHYISNTLREFAKQKYSSYHSFFLFVFFKRDMLFFFKKKQKKKENCLLTLQIFTA